MRQKPTDYRKALQQIEGTMEVLLHSKELVQQLLKLPIPPLAKKRRKDMTPDGVIIVPGMTLYWWGSEHLGKGKWSEKRANPFIVISVNKGAGTVQGVGDMWSWIKDSYGSLYACEKYGPREQD